MTEAADDCVIATVSENRIPRKEKPRMKSWRLRIGLELGSILLNLPLTAVETFFYWYSTAQTDLASLVAPRSLLPGDWVGIRDELNFRHKFSLF